VDIGLLAMHGVYGSKIDYTANGCKQMYFPVTSGGGAGYVRMSEMNFGGSAPSSGSTNGLKWMAILACNSLYSPNWHNMDSLGVKPYNGNLHMLLGAATEFAGEPLIGQYWADLMLGNPSAKPTARQPMKIRDAWYQAARNVYAQGTARGENSGYINPTVFATATDPNCFDDTLQANSSPAGSGLQYDSSTVYP
jgi:hypothetical protein